MRLLENVALTALLYSAWVQLDNILYLSPDSNLLRAAGIEACLAQGKPLHLL